MKVFAIVASKRKFLFILTKMISFFLGVLAYISGEVFEVMVYTTTYKPHSI